MKWVKMRNPWGANDWHKKRAKYAVDKSVYGADEQAVKKMTWNKGTTPGTFLMTYEDFLS